MGIDATKRWNRIGFYSSVSPIEKLMASSCDETETIYCEPAVFNGRNAGIEPDPIPVFLSVIEKLMASGCDETETIYCEPGFKRILSGS